jgi:drug/metabolite transporter (DMT)-like permease
VGCGALFVVYEFCLYVAIGLASSRQQVLEVGIINYLWPGLTLAFSIPILKRRARPWLVPGMLMAFAGVFLAAAQRESFSWASLPAGGRGRLLPYLLAFVGAICWGLYSNFSRRWAANAQGVGVPLFLLATGVVMALLRPVFHESSDWAREGLPLTVYVVLVYIALVPGLLAYVFWDFAMRRGRMILVAAFSYLTPLFSTLVSCLYLQVWPARGLWIACGLLVGGAFICKLSIEETEQRAAPSASS